MPAASAKKAAKPKSAAKAGPKAGKRKVAAGTPAPRQPATAARPGATWAEAEAPAAPAGPPPATTVDAATLGWTAAPPPQPAPGLRPLSAPTAPSFAGTPRKPTMGLARALVVLLVTTVALSGLDLVLDLTVPGWMDVSPSAAMAAVQTLLNVLGAGVGIATVVVFCVWLHRILGTAAARHPAAGISPGWGIGSFFIPVAHVILPFFEVRKAWKADVSDDAGPVAAWFVPWSLSVVLAYVGAIVGVAVGFQAFLDIAGQDGASEQDIEEEAQEVADDLRPALLVVSGLGFAFSAVAAFFLARLAKRWSAHQDGAPPVASPVS